MSTNAKTWASRLREQEFLDCKLAKVRAINVMPHRFWLLLRLKLD